MQRVPPQVSLRARGSSVESSDSVLISYPWVQEAVRWLLSGKTIFDPKSPMGDYNYSGSNRWSSRERQQFRRAWKVHRKQFNMLRSTVSGENKWVEFSEWA